MSISIAIVRRTPPAVLIAFGLIALALAIIGIRHLLRGDPDRAHLDHQRSSRLAMSKRAETLPGTPDLGNLKGRLAEHGLVSGAPVFIRIFKHEFELELWVKRDDRYHRFAAYPICRFSGELGPKLIEGDRQSPEGFYVIGRRSLNPNSRWHRAFNLGFPNSYDQAHGRTGSFLMVHGGCSSIGCYAMTNPVIDEVWRLVDAALKGGQKAIPVHVFPFRMSAENLAARAASPWAGFWAGLKPGYDAVEATQLPPRVSVCDGSYKIEPRVDDDTADGNINTDCGLSPVLPVAAGGSGKPVESNAQGSKRKLSGSR